MESKEGILFRSYKPVMHHSDGKIITQKVKARIKALYPHVVQLQLPNGITRSPTYWELERLKTGGDTDGQEIAGRK